MLTGIDHLVIAVDDLEAARASYTALGFTVVEGGRHTGIGTYNALIAFQDGAYLELIAFYEPRDDHRWFAPLQKGQGLVDFCLQTDDLPADTLALRRAGVDIGEPEHRNRKRPDGKDIRWIFSLARGAHRGVAPFIIADESGRDERVPRERTHANGVTGIGTVTVAVDDLARVRGWYASVLGRRGEDVTRPELAGAGVRFTIGPHAFEFLAPAGAGAIKDWLAARGPSPYAATLRTAGAARGPLDAARAHGARLSYA
ncbi:MAG TPA: VOC family protein [Candidatus Limnocylindria bacterium]|nr:VOC family protein [Candidatus Limnocylindria bacterium]